MAATITRIEPSGNGTNATSLLPFAMASFGVPAGANMRQVLVAVREKIPNCYPFIPL